MFDKAENRSHDARLVLSNYRRWLELDKIDENSLRFLGSAGGYSGAMFWQLIGPSQTYCLRRWPNTKTINSDRLLSIHRLLTGIHELGGSFVPVPVKSSNDSTIVSCNGVYWHLEPWMPGEANYWRFPSSEKLASAMQSLADFHRLAAQAAPGLVSKKASAAIQERRNLLKRYVSGGRPTNLFERLRFSATNATDIELRELAPLICEQFLRFSDKIECELQRASRIPAIRQPVISDVWHDHVLFADNQVSGLVDFGQMRQDSPAMDIARLLGSLVGDDENGWKYGLENYQNRIDLQDSEKELVRIFDRSTTLLSGINWLQWICIENRDFGDLHPILVRLRKISDRMSNI